MFLREVAHEAVQGDKVGFGTALDRAGQIDETAVGWTLPQRSARGVVGCWAAVAFAPGFDVLDCVFLLAPDGAGAVDRFMGDEGVLGWRWMLRCVMGLRMQVDWRGHRMWWWCLWCL